VTTPRVGLARGVGWRTAAAVVVANMLGTGVFTTSGLIARDVGSAWLLLALWLAGGLIALAGALAYGELSAAMPEAGGEYVYLREAYGPVVAYLSGWTSFLAGFSGAIAAATLAFASYASRLVPELGALDSRLIALVALWLLTAAHLAGAGLGGTFQAILTAATVIAIVAFVTLGVAAGRGASANFVSSAPAHGSLAVALIFVLYAYSGWNAAAYLAGEVVEPQRGVPRALLAGTAGVTALYVSLNALYVWALPVPEMSGVLAIGERAAESLFGPRAATVCGAIIALAILSSVSAMVFAGPRVYYAMARDGVLPRALGHAITRSETPARAIALQSVWVSVLIVCFGAFEPVVVYTGTVVAIFSAIAVAAVIVLRVRRPRLLRPFRTPGYPWLPAAYIAVCVWIFVYTAHARPMETALGLATAAAGLPIYWLSARHVSPRGQGAADG